MQLFGHGRLKGISAIEEGRDASRGRMTAFVEVSGCLSLSGNAIGKSEEKVKPRPLAMAVDTVLSAKGTSQHRVRPA